MPKKKVRNTGRSLRRGKRDAFPGYRKDGHLDLRSLPKIVYRGLYGNDGLAHHRLFSPVGDPGFHAPLIEIDNRLDGRLRLEAEIHELIHLTIPALTEETVMKSARYISRALWKVGYDL
jgi:hypothetical protein